MKNAILFFLCIAAFAIGEVISKPDDNTLWLETGRNMQFDANAYSGKWVSSKLKFTEAEEGCFIVEPKEGKSNSDGICVPFSKEYPYLEYELEVLEANSGAYMLFPSFTNLGPSYQQQRGIRSGYYVVNVFENSKLKGSGKAFMNIRVFNAKVKIKNLRMVKEPKYRFDVLYRKHNFGKPLPMSAVLEMSFSTKGAALPERLRVNYIDTIENVPIDLSGKRFSYLEKGDNNVGELFANPEIVSLGSRNMNGGTVMMLVEGMDVPVITWLPYAWNQPALKNTVQALPDSLDWINGIRTEHPRIFINKDTIPRIREWAKEIDCSQILLDAETFRIDENKREKTRGFTGDKRPYGQQDVEVLIPCESEAMTCAVAYILTGEKKYADRCFYFLKHCLRAYQDCAAKRTRINWFGLRRITAMAAFDWIYNELPEAERKQWLKDFVDVNIKYARHGWHGPFMGVNGGVGTTSGFYGDSNNELFMGVLAYKEGVCDELALDMLKEGYDKYMKCMNYRDSVAEDDGILSTVAMGYSAGQYPWASYDFLALWRTLFKKDIVLPKFTHLMYYGEWAQWNMLPGKGNISMREFGLADNAKTDMMMWSISGHLYYIASLYGKDYPDEAAQIAASIARMDGKYDVDFYKAKEKTQRRTAAPKYYETFFRRLLAYGIKDTPKAAPGNATHAMARHFPSGGVFFMHGNEPKDRTYALFNVGSRLVAHKTRGDENHFSIFRKGYLAIDSGYRCDAWTFHYKYHHSSVAHNTMLIHDPDEVFEDDIKNIKSGVQHFANDWKDSPEAKGMIDKMMPYIGEAQGSQYKPLGGKCRAFSTNEHYSYIVGDATSVYSDRKCAEFTRQFLHLQPDVFVVFDRVEARKPEFKKEWLLHFLEEPQVNGNVTEASVSDEGGHIRCTSLLPINGKIEKIGGPGKEFWGGKVNWTAPNKVLDKVNYGGKWRISLSPSKTAKRDYFLNVIEVGDQPVKEMKCSENKDTVTLDLVLHDGKKVEITFNKDGEAGGKITIGSLSQPLTQQIQPQAGFLF
ncbi:MAG: heparinase II/III family protein [Victivallales bacterium]|nr:heparinase II/III family protein [Victivallales bacterium]